MVRIPASQAREKFAEILNEVAFGNERVVLHRHGKPVAVVVSVEDWRKLEELEDRTDLAAAKKALADRTKAVAWKSVKEELGLK